MVNRSLFVRSLTSTLITASNVDNKHGYVCSKNCNLVKDSKECVANLSEHCNRSIKNSHEKHHGNRDLNIKK